MTRAGPGLGADRTRALKMIPVSRETAARLDQLVALVLKWQKTTNLVAGSTLNQIWTRHIADSLQLLPLAPDARVWVDLGSGGGFPGLAVACALAERPACMVHLVESNAKKAAFLREATRSLALPALVHGQRIEEFTRSYDESADVVTARALAPLDRLLEYSAPLLARGAKGLFLKGQHVEAELTQASKYWMIEADLVASKTSPEGRIVIVRRAERRRPDGGAHE